MTGFQLQTFGFPEIRSFDGSVRLNLRKGLALLVHLAEARAVVSRDVVATLLWPDSAIDVARARLRRLLHRIEQALGQPVFETDRTSLRWSPSVELSVDTQLFEAACERGDFAQACGYYHGDFLAGFALPDCPEFEEWAFFRREALRGRYLHALERLVQDNNAAGDHAAAAARATRLVELDPLSEIYGRHLIRSLLLAGDRLAAERHHAALTRRLRDELGVTPEKETEELMHEAATPAALTIPATRYAEGDGIHLAYQTFGSGELDILVMPGFVSHVERVWEHPSCRAFLVSMMALGRLIIFDRRGVGLSDRVGSAPNVDVTAEDIGTVLRAAEARRVVLFGASECGPACIKFAVDHPRLVAGLILFGSLAKGCRAPNYPYALTVEQYEVWRRQLIGAWVAQPASRRSAQASRTMPNPKRGGPGCSARLPVPAASGPCWQLYVTPMSWSCCPNSLSRPWCYTDAATALSGSRRDATWPLGSPARNLSSSTATTTGSSRVTNVRCSTPSDRLSAASFAERIRSGPGRVLEDCEFGFMNRGMANKNARPFGPGILSSPVSLNRVAQAPLRNFSGSTGVDPFRISKCSCGEDTSPLWPDLAIT